MIGIYHNKDLDGFTSGAIMKHKYPEIELIGHDYGEPFGFEKFRGQDVIMADVSLPMEEMKHLEEITKSFLWIDHHTSAIEDYYAQDWKLETVPVLEVGISACELTWKTLFSDIYLPEGVLLLGEYDTWRNSDKTRWDNKILPFQYGMRSICKSPINFPTHLFQDGSGETLNRIKSIGRTIIMYQSQMNETNCRKNSFEDTFEGLSAICMNGGPFNSQTFDSVYDPLKHKLMMPFQFNGRFWTVSLYTTHDDVDCSVLAKKWGGGGHKKAAGFQVDDISDVFPITSHLGF